MEQKEIVSKASLNLKRPKRRSRLHHSAPAGKGPGSSWGFSRILYTVWQNWTWTLPFKSILCALRPLSYYEHLIKKKRKKKKGKKNRTGLWIGRPGFLPFGFIRIHHFLPTWLLTSPLSAVGFQFFICTVRISALLPLRILWRAEKFGMWKQFLKCNFI